MASAATPGEAAIREARGVAARHRRRRHPNTVRCGHCQDWWRVVTTRAGTTIAGCRQRRRALHVLEAAGMLDGHGRVCAPAAVVPA